MISRLLLTVICYMLITAIYPLYALADAADSLVGLAIADIQIEHDSNLRDSDLIATLGLQVGDIIDEDRLSEAMAKLRLRDIFRDIALSTEAAESGVRLKFVCRTFPVISLVEFIGERAVEERTLRKFAGLQLGARLGESDLEEARNRIEYGYRDYGHFAARVTYTVDRRSVDALMRVRFEISEGPTTKLNSVTVSGTFAPEVSTLRERFSETATGRVASVSELKALSRELLLALRNEGYLEAYVRASDIEFEPLTGEASVEFAVETRDPISISFEGNSLFSTEELLSLLRMDTRTVPFSPNAVPTLTREIEKYYERRGYFFTSVGYQPLPPEGLRREFKITIHESELYRVGSILFHGNTVFSARQLREVMQTAPAGFFILKNWEPGFLSIEQLENDIETIRAKYEAEGYYRPSVQYELSSEGNSHRIDIKIAIEEPAQTKVQAIKVVWNQLATRPENATGALLSLFPALKTGEPFTEQRIEAARFAYLNKISSLGYPAARVDTETNRDTGEITFTVTLGQYVHVGRIVNKGNIFTRDSVINQEVSLQSGAPWDPALARASEQNLYRLGFFRAVSIAPLDGALDSSVEDMAVKVTERDSGSFEFGGDINSEDGLHLVAEIRQRNFRGNGNGLALGTDAYIKSGDRILDAGTVRAVYSDPRVGRSSLEMYNELYLQQSIELNQSFSYDRYGNSNLLRFPMSEAVSGSAGLSLYRERLYDVPVDIVIGEDDEGSLFYSKLSSELDVDFRNDRFNPSRGFRSIFRSEIASGHLGSEVDFAGVSTQQTGYLPLSNRLVWVNNLSLQALVPIGSTDEIPLSQRIFLGGRNSLRGFSPNKVGPRGADGNIVGGDTSIVANSQLEYSLTESILTTLFFDMGQTRLEYKGSFTGDTLSLDDLRYSPGVGLHYKTPIGPIGVEYGVALDREYGERFGRLNFSIGSAF